MSQGKPVTDVIRDLRGGLFVANATEELAALVERIQDSGKKGSLTITLELTPSGKGNRIMHVKPKLTVKMPPKPDTDEAAIFYVERGQLLRDDPNQTKLDLDKRREEKLSASGGSPSEVEHAQTA